MAKAKYSDKLIGLRCGTCKNRNYYTRKNRKVVERKIEFSKFCSTCREHKVHKEMKISGK